MDEMQLFERRAILYDFYGALLTDHQKKILEDVVLNDYSISEVADNEGITRQGVFDLLKRCDRILEDYETKLGLVAKFEKIKEIVKGSQFEDEILEIL